MYNALFLTFKKLIIYIIWHLKNHNSFQQQVRKRKIFYYLSLKYLIYKSFINELRGGGTLSIE